MKICKNCPDRVYTLIDGRLIDCHPTCKAYQNLKKQREQIADARRKSYNQYVFDKSIKRNLRSRKSKKF